MNQKTLKFTGDYQQLQDMLLLAGTYGEWTDLEQIKQFRTESGGVLNWWPSTGTLSFQGKPAAKNELFDTVEKRLAKNRPSMAATTYRKIAR